MNDQSISGLMAILSNLGNSEGAIFWLLTGLLMGFALLLLIILKNGRKRAMAEDMLRHLDNELK